MTQISFSENQNLEHMCKQVLSFPDIRFCGVINHLGNQIAGGFREGITPLESDEKRRMTYMQMILDTNMRKEHDDSLGQIEYTATKRKNVLMISIPISNYLVLISSDPASDAHQITKLVSHIFKSCSNKITA